MLFPSIGPYLRGISTVGAIERSIVERLTRIIAERRRNFDAFEGTDLIQLLLQQDIERQANEKAPLLLLGPFRSRRCRTM